MRKSNNYFKFLEYVTYGKGYVRVVPCYYNGKLSTKYMTIQYWGEK